MQAVANPDTLRAVVEAARENRRKVGERRVQLTNTALDAIKRGELAEAEKALTELARIAA